MRSPSLQLAFFWGAQGYHSDNVAPRGVACIGALERMSEPQGVCAKCWQLLDKTADAPQNAPQNVPGCWFHTLGKQFNAQHELLQHVPVSRATAEPWGPGAGNP